MKPHPTKSKPRIAPYLAPRPPAPVDAEWAKAAAEECYDKIGRGNWEFESSTTSIERFADIIESHAPAADELARLRERQDIFYARLAEVLPLVAGGDLVDASRALVAHLATLRRERDELRAELLTTHQMACRVGLERDKLAKMLETECNTLQVELVEAERKFQDGFDCVPFCELSSAANALLSRIRAALQSLRALTEQPGKP